MPKFFLKVGHTLQPKNRLQEEVVKYFESHDRTLIGNESTLTKFKQTLECDVKALNEKHHTCKPVQLNIGDVRYGNISHQYISVTGLVNLNIYKVKFDLSTDNI